MAAPATGPHPRNARELFWVFSHLAMQGFGGVLGVVQRELVERRGWMSNEEFLEEWGLAQVLPGPNVCNLALMYGWRQHGPRGALAALAGLLALPLVVLLLVASLFRLGADQPQVAAALRGMGAVTVGIIAGAGIKLMLALRSHRLGAGVAMALAGLALLGITWLDLPLPAIVASVGGASCAWLYRCLCPDSGAPG
jgi:chromate transporter